MTAEKKDCRDCEHYRQDLEDAWCVSPDNEPNNTNTSRWVAYVLCGDSLPQFEPRVKGEKQ